MLLTAPAGYGKTISAIDASLSMKNVQYIGQLRDFPLDMDVLGPPEPFGIAIARLANLLYDERGQHGPEEMADVLQIIQSVSNGNALRFIVDDLGVVEDSVLALLQETIEPILSEPASIFGLLLARSAGPDGFGSLSSLYRTRLVLPGMLAFDRDETDEAINLGLINVPAGIEAAEFATYFGGWIAGMKAATDGAGESHIDNLILNDVLIDVSQSEREIILMAANLPIVTVALLEHLNRAAGLPIDQVRTSVARVPAIHSSRSGKLTFAPVIRESLSRLSGFWSRQDMRRMLELEAIRWYCSAGLYQEARSFSRQCGRQTDYLEIVEPRIDELARSEEWEAISALVDSLEHREVIQNDTVAFWYLSSLYSLHLEIQANELAALVLPKWRTATDAVWRGRALLVDAGRALATCNTRLSADLAANAYVTLPKQLHRERFHAAVTAYSSQCHIKLDVQHDRWQQRILVEYSRLPAIGNWFLNSGGPIAMGFAAMSGRLEEVYRRCHVVVERLPTAQPESATEFILVCARIDLERGELDSAAALIQTALARSPTAGASPSVARVKALLCCTRKQMDEAEALLEVRDPTRDTSLPEIYQHGALRAYVALNQGKMDKAEALLRGLPALDDPWPMRLGDVNTTTVHALLLATAGDCDASVAMLQGVAAEAINRSHTSQVVNAYAALAWVNHLAGDHSACKDAVERAREAAGSYHFSWSFVILGSDVREFYPDTDANTGTPEQSRERLRRFDLLTQRETELAACVAQGLTNQEIADHLFISVSTVKNHLRSVFRKLEVQSRLELRRLLEDSGAFDSVPRGSGQLQHVSAWGSIPRGR